MSVRQERPRVLIGLADRSELRLLVQLFQQRQFRVLKASTGRELIEEAIEHVPDVILLDSELRNPDGLAVLALLREWYRQPVLMMGDRSDLEIEARAFAVGVTGYLYRPISNDELILRIEAVHHRATRQRVSRSGSFVRVGFLLIDLVARRASIAGESINLTSTEFALLGALAQNLNRVVSNEELIELVWGSPESGTIDSLRTYVKQIRRKIQPHADSPQYLRTITGVGYCLATPDSERRVVS